MVAPAPHWCFEIRWRGKRGWFSPMNQPRSERFDGCNWDKSMIAGDCVVKLMNGMVLFGSAIGQ
jgi:hypothetical protein